MKFPMILANMPGMNGPVRVIPVADISLHVPLFHSVVAGFPSPADDYREEQLDVAAYLVKNPSSTFFIRVEGESMIEAGIYPDDILVVDRSLQAGHGQVIVAVLNGEFTVKRLHRQQGTLNLRPANPAFKDIPVQEGDEFRVWGVVTHVLHRPV